MIYLTYAAALGLWLIAVFMIFLMASLAMCAANHLWAWLVAKFSHEEPDTSHKHNGICHRRPHA